MLMYASRLRLFNLRLIRENGAKRSLTNRQLGEANINKIKSRSNDLRFSFHVPQA